LHYLQYDLILNSETDEIYYNNKTWCFHQAEPSNEPNPGNVTPDRALACYAGSIRDEIHEARCNR
jgi:hypothetical protein